MPNNPTVKKLWNLYHDEVMPKNPHPIQLQETRRAFYMGAHSVMTIFTKITDLPEDEGVEILEEITDEIQQFMRDVLDGKA